MWVYCENLSSIGCLVAEKSLCGGWYNSRIESLQVLSTFDFWLWTRTLDLDCDKLLYLAPSTRLLCFVIREIVTSPPFHFAYERALELTNRWFFNIVHQELFHQARYQIIFYKVLVWSFKTVSWNSKIFTNEEALNLLPPLQEVYLL